MKRRAVPSPMAILAVLLAGAVAAACNGQTVTPPGPSALPTDTLAPPTAVPRVLPMDWPIPPLTAEQVNSVRQCDLENTPAQRYPKALTAPKLLEAFAPQTDCDWAILAVAYTDRRGEEEPLSEAAQYAITQAVAGNPGFALADALFYRTFGAVSLVRPPAFAQQEITAVSLSYTWAGLGDPVQYAVQIDGADAEPRVTSAYSDALTIDRPTVQALAPALSDLLPVPSQFQIQPCYDNYPVWSVALTFADGRVTKLETDSNVLYLGEPWFTEIDGQVYMQVSAAFAQAIGRLIEGMGLPLGETAAMSCFPHPVLDVAFATVSRFPTVVPALASPTPAPARIDTATPGRTPAATRAAGPADNVVRAIAVAPDGAVWFGTDGGASRYLQPPEAARP